jgi:hypothetical protein
VAECVACWKELSEVGKALGTVTSETMERMRGLFGCEPIVEQLYRVVSMDAAEAGRRFPRIVAHLARCASCRGLLADLEAVSLTEPPPAAISWRDVIASGGEQIRELIGEVALRLQQGLVASARWPDGLVMVPVGAAAGATRGREKGPGSGGEPAALRGAPGQAFRLDLDTIALGVELLIEAHDADRVRLEVQVLRGERPVRIALRRVEGDREELVAAQDAAPSKKFVAANLQPGAYHLDVRDPPTAGHRRIRVVLERG